TRTNEEYDEDRKVVKREKITSHKSTSGVPAAAASETCEDSDIEYYSPSVTKEVVVEGAGRVERLSVAAMIDLSPMETPAINSGTPPMTLADATEIIKKAVGFKQGRDEIKVTEAKLASTGTGTPSIEKGGKTLVELDADFSVTRDSVLFGIL